jgi:hypothetical protein
MNQKTIIISIALFILIVLGMFVFAYLKKAEVTAPEQQTPNEQPQEEVAYAAITRVTAKHFYVDGVHTLAGEIPMPTPCDLLEADARVAESFPEQVTVDFTVINTAEFCAQQVTNQRFKVSVSASEDATFKATFMGRDVELNLVPPEEGETPENFELFIKG